jgi:hypothetical protein
MCDPLTIAGAALTVGSTVANSAAASRAARARDDALAAERIRQGGFDQEAQALNTRSQDRYEDFQGQQEQKATRLADYFVPAAPDTTGPNATAAAAMPSNASNIVTREMAKRSGEARDFTNQQGASLANLRAFGDVLGDVSREQGRDASLLGQIGGFKRGSSNVVPLELDEASRKGQGLRLLGDLMGGFGGMALSAGLTGGSLGGMFGGSKPLSAVGSMGPVARAGTVVKPPSLYPQQLTGIY